MATTKKYLDYDGLVQYTGKVKKAINDASYTHGVTDIGGDTTAPTYDSDVNATAATRNASFTKDGSASTFPYKDTTYGAASTTKDGLMTHEDKVKLDGIATGATKVTVDSSMSTTSTNPVQNKVVKAAVDAAAKTVRQTVASGNTGSPVLLGGGNETDEVKYTDDIQYSPSTRTTSIHTNGKTAGTSMTFSFEGGTLHIGTSTIDGASYSGRATGTETLLTANTSLGSNGAAMIGYWNEIGDTATTVEEALNELMAAVGEGGGEESLVSRVTSLEDNKADKTAAVGNITGTSGGNETGNFTKVSGTAGTFSYKNDKVSQTADTTTSTAIPLLLASGSTPSTAGAKYNTSLAYTPSTGTVKIGSGTLTATNYSGTAARATADGSGNDIAGTYATKSALDTLTQKWTGQFKIATASEKTAIEGGDAGALELGYIYLVDTGSGNNVYDEYIKVAKGTTPETYAVEKIGTTDAGVDVVSLTTAEINTIWSTTAAAS